MSQNGASAGNITPSELKNSIDAGEKILLLDVRNEDEFGSWRVEGKKIPETLNIPYFAFIEEPEAQIAKVPRDREIAVVCAKGGSSDYVAELLREKGYRAKNVSGGMIAWGDALDAVPVPGAAGGTVFFQIARYGKGCLSYLIGGGGEALVVDPSRRIDAYLELARENELTIKHVLDTHLHADHISGGRALAAAAGADYRISPHDGRGAAFEFEPLRDGDTLRVGNATARIIAIESPGHTPGSTSILIDDRFLLTGDTLFVRGAGRPDLGGKAEPWARSLHETLFRKFAPLSGDVLILPAHYSSPDEAGEGNLVAAKLGEIRKNNPAMQARDADAFVGFILERLAPQPASYDEIRRVNLGIMAADEEKLTEYDLGKNQCAAMAGARKGRT